MPVEKRRTGALAMASIVDVERKPGDEDAIKAYNALMLEAWVTVQAHATFKNIVQEEPKEISAGGVQTPFNQEDFTTAIRTHGHYKCGVNLAWVNFLWTPTPNIPIRICRLWELRDSFFKHPQRIEQITIAVASHDEDVLAQKRGTAPSQPGGDYLSVPPGSREGHQEQGARRMHPKVEASHVEHQLRLLSARGPVEALLACPPKLRGHRKHQ